MNRTHRLRRSRLMSLALSLGALIAVSGLSLVANVLAAGNSISVSPAATTISPAGSTGGTFTVNVTGNGTVPLSGAAAALNFDNTRLLLTAVAMDPTEVANGVGYAGFPGASGKAAFIAAANAAGQIPTIGWSYTDGTSSEPAGADHGIFSATFQVIGAGDTTIDPIVVPTVGGLIDGSAATYGDTLSPITLHSGAVVNPGLASQNPCPTPSSSVSPLLSPSPSLGASSSAGAVPSASATPPECQTPSPCSVAGVLPASSPTQASTSSESSLRASLATFNGSALVSVSGVLEPDLTSPQPSPSATPCPTPSSSPSSLPSSSPSATATPTPGPVEANRIAIVPANPTGAAIGGYFTVQVVVHTAVPVSGVQATITFDHTLLQVFSVTRGSTWASAPFYLGATAANIATANASGSLRTVGAKFLAPDSVAAGETVFLNVTFKAIGCGHSALGLPPGEPFDGVISGAGSGIDYGVAIQPISATGGSVDISCTLASPTPGSTQTPLVITRTITRTITRVITITPGAVETIAAQTGTPEGTASPTATRKPAHSATPTPKAGPANHVGTGGNETAFAILFFFTGLAWSGALVTIYRYGVVGLIPGTRRQQPEPGGGGSAG